MKLKTNTQCWVSFPSSDTAWLGSVDTQEVNKKLLPDDCQTYENELPKSFPDVQNWYWSLFKPNCKQIESNRCVGKTKHYNFRDRSQILPNLSRVSLNLSFSSWLLMLAKFIPWNLQNSPALYQFARKNVSMKNVLLFTLIGGGTGRVGSPSSLSCDASVAMTKS